jgi:hypothetical protein
MKWDEWRGNGKPAMWIKRLGYLFGRTIDLHKVVASDDPDCFHTHPSYCFRLILWGGYVEELHGGEKVTWRPGSFGIVSPSLCHRFDSLLNGPSYSLWIRGKVRAKVELRGNGWPDGAETQSKSHLDARLA